MQQRKTITLNLAGLLEQSPSARRFYDEYTQNAGHAVKRNLVDRIFRAGSVLDACGLSAIVNLLDNEVFQSASITERQAMFFKAAELAGVVPAGEKGKVRKPQKGATKEDSHSEEALPEAKADETANAATVAGDKKPPGARGTGAGKMFSSFQQPKNSGDS